MIPTIEEDIKKRSTLLRSDLNKYLVDKNLIEQYPKRIWFKGSRNRYN